MSLLGWENSDRIQFIIDTVEDTIDVVPFAFKLNASVGLGSFNNAYVFDKLATGTSSVPNKKKVIFSQLVDGEEIPLYSELDTWDHSGRKALFWVKPKKYYTNNINIFYFYFDKTMPDNNTYLAETNTVPVILFRNINTCSYDSSGTLPFDILNVNGIYRLWFMGYNGSKWQILHCTSTDFITWTTPILAFSGTHTYDTSDMHKGSVIFDVGIYKMWYSGSNGTWRIMYCTSTDGINWSNFQMVITNGLCADSYSQNHALCCTVIKENGVYKMWYAGMIQRTSVIYCESLDGIVWYGHRMVIYCDQIATDDARELRPCKVLLKDNLYIMWFEVYHNATGKWRLYCCDSFNGIYWSNFRIFANYGLEGVYDTSQTIFLAMLEEESSYIFIYGGYNGTNWRIVYSKSASLTNPRTPAQEVWSDGFFSVHHLNPSYGYKDSTNNRLNIVSNHNVLSSTSNLGNGSLILQNNNGYINFGNNSAYNFSTTTSIVLFGKFNSGNIFFAKDLYNVGTISLIKHDELLPINTSNSFSGPDYSQVAFYLWYKPPVINQLSSNVSYILNNTLYMAATCTAATYNIYKTTYTLSGNFDIQVDYSSLVLSTNDHYTGIDFSVSPLDNSSTNYLRVGYLNGNSIMCGQGFGTSLAAYSARYYNYGSLRFARVGSTLNLYFKDGPIDWVLYRSWTVSTVDMVVSLGHYFAYYFSTSMSISNYFSNFMVNSGTTSDYRGDLRSNVLSLCTTNSSRKILNNMVDSFSFDNTWNAYVAARSTGSGANCTLILPQLSYNMSTVVDTLNTNTSNFLVGYSANSVNGELSEVWFTNKVFTAETSNFINNTLKDTAVLISKYFIQGYVTKYNRAVVKKVVVYSTITNQLLGITFPSPVDGYYYCEVPYSTECTVLALDGTNYNHFILGKVTPTQL